jgi:hypothetical protein
MGIRVGMGDGRHWRLRATSGGMLGSHVRSAPLLARITLCWCTGNASCVARTRALSFFGPSPRSGVWPWVAFPQARKYGENRAPSSSLFDF